MNCKKIQDLLITDFIDGETDTETTQKISEHLENCEKCHLFLQEICSTLTTPFQNIKPMKLRNSFVFSPYNRELDKNETSKRLPKIRDLLIEIFCPTPLNGLFNAILCSSILITWLWITNNHTSHNILFHYIYESFSAAELMLAFN